MFITRVYKSNSQHEVAARPYHQLQQPRPQFVINPFVSSRRSLQPFATAATAAAAATKRHLAANG
jgi:hypothetical protein